MGSGASKTSEAPKVIHSAPTPASCSQSYQALSPSFSTQIISMTVMVLTLQVRTSSGGSVSRTADDAPKGDVPKISQRSEVSTAGDGALPEHWCLGSKPTVIVIQAERAQIASGITPRPQILRMAVRLMTCAAASKFGCLGLGVSSADFSKLPNQELER